MTALPPDGPPDGRDGAGDASRHDLDFVVPDDISELEPDIAAVRRELAAARRARARRGTAFGAPRSRWLRAGIAAPLMIGVLLVAGVCGALLSIGAPRTAPPSPPVSQASPAVQTGHVGGLLPTVSLKTATGTLSTAQLRPALLAIVPAACAGCAGSVHRLVAQAAGLTAEVLFVAASPRAAREAGTLAQIMPTVARTATDPAGTLAKAYGARANQLTLLLVRSDGVVTNVLHGFGRGVRLEDGFTVTG